MVLKLLLSTQKYRISFESIDGEVYFRIYNKRNKKIEHIKVYNSFNRLINDFNDFRVNETKLLEKFKRHMGSYSNFYGEGLNFKKGLPTDLTTLEFLVIKKNIKNYKNKLLKERGVAQ